MICILAYKPVFPGPYHTVISQGGAASGVSASDTTANRLPVALLERRVEQRTKERDEVTKDRGLTRAKAEELEEKSAELEAKQEKVMLL